MKKNEHGAKNPKAKDKSLQDEGMAMIAGGLSGKYPKWNGEIPATPFSNHGGTRAKHSDTSLEIRRQF